MVSILLVDEHDMVRAAFKQLLETSDDFEVVAEASGGEEACRKYMQHNPDVIVLDLSLPGTSGLATLRRLVARDENIHVIVLSLHDDPPIVARALKLGAKGFVSKSAPFHELQTAISEVCSGSQYIEERLHTETQQILQNKNPASVLTDREFEVLTMLAEGKSVVEISDLLHLSSKTVGAHRTSIMKKLYLNNSAELVRAAILWDIIKL
ncbi:two-component system, NarL family, invasion response regulator UvrY [Mariprofundus micogutta]|uniref:Two-component system, NarL family, invasion response regulator UvrY n=1 Tax=Mariprofundus micogutta TaxID=1921010 RepID=A0A1L8CPB4_9PROT|nr:response regulator transcription factor [Mariprofundus micogutta]GAV20760.1 two-component system, NarL family, invasion response regulator UvrY [Mariprofundus micogutta]